MKPTKAKKHKDKKQIKEDGMEKEKRRKGAILNQTEKGKRGGN
jgi:hypothetical protein